MVREEVTIVFPGKRVEVFGSNLGKCFRITHLDLDLKVFNYSTDFFLSGDDECKRLWNLFEKLT